MKDRLLCIRKKCFAWGQMQQANIRDYSSNSTIKKPRMQNFGGKISEKIKNVEMTVLLFFQVSWQTLWRSSSFAEWDRSKLEIPPKSQFYVNPKFCFKAKTGSIKMAAVAAAKLFPEIWKLRQEKTLFAKFAESLKGSLLMETKRERKF